MSERRRNIIAVNDNRPDCADDPHLDALPAMPDVTILDLTAQLLVWATRRWVQAFKAGEDFGVATGEAFARFDLSPAGTALDRVMTILAAATTRAIDVRCPHCRLLSPDEASLVDAVAAAQGDRMFEATVALRRLMPGTAARSALAPLLDLARGLAARGLVARPLPRSVGRPAAATRTLH